MSQHKHYMTCPSCSAPLENQKDECSYCGARIDKDLAAMHFYTKATPESERKCASCQHTMDTIDLKIGGNNSKESFLIEQCPECFSLFFDPGEIEALLEKSIHLPTLVDHSKLKELIETQADDQYEVSYRPCPVCDKIMNRSNFGHRSGVIVDTCKEHGIFLDNGELRRLMLWRKAGGQTHHHQIEAEKQRQENRRLKQKMAAQNFDQSESSYIHYGNSNSSKPIDIGDLFSFVGRLFS